jgi:hypothetical protein
MVQNDRGDVIFGGVLPPDAFSVANNAIYWCERTKADMPPGTNGYMTETSAATIYTRNIWPTDAAIGGVGSIVPY